MNARRARPSIRSLTLSHGCIKASIQHKIEKGVNNDKWTNKAWQFHRIWSGFPFAPALNSTQQHPARFALNPSLFSAHFSLCYYFHYPLQYICVCIHDGAYLRRTIPLIHTNARNAGRCCFLFTPKSYCEAYAQVYVCVCACVCAHLNYSRLKFYTRL